MLKEFIKKASDTQKKKVVIIEGNPVYENSTGRMKNFYDSVENYITTKHHAEVVRDKGLPYTSPPEADLWIGHSRGVDRLQYAEEGTKLLALGSTAIHDNNHNIVYVNHPKDPSGLITKSPMKFTEKERRDHINDPNQKYHFMFTNKMKNAIDTLIKKAGLVYHGSPTHGLTQLDPRPSGVLDKEHAVFASPQKWTAIASTAPWKDSDITQGSINGKPYMKEKYPGAFEKIYNKPGVVYHLDDTGFSSDPRLTNYEMINKNPVSILKHEVIQNPLESLKQEGVRLVRYKERNKKKLP